MKVWRVEDGGRIVDTADASATCAWLAGDNILAPGWRPPPGADPVICYSGTLADGPFERHPRNWMSSGREALDAFCASAAGDLGERQLWLHPHARHVLSDPPSCLRFLSEHDGEPFGVVLAPASLLEPGMLEDLEDHLARSFEMLGPRCAAVLLQDVVVEGEDCRPAPLGTGMLPQAGILDLLGRWVRPDTAVIVAGGDWPAEREWLAGGAGMLPPVAKSV